MASRKRKDRSRRQRETQRKKRKGSRSRSGSGAHLPRTWDPIPGSLDRPEFARDTPPIHVEHGLRRVPDPYLELGLEPDGAHTTEDVQAAWRRAIERHPPEREPEIARALTTARDRLLAPDKVIERRLGVLYPPDPEAYGLPTEAGPRTSSDRLSSRTRLLGQLVLYALLEEELSGEKPERRETQTELPF